MGGGERWLGAGFAALPFDGGKQRGFLSADVCPRAAADLDVEALPASGRVVAEEAGSSRLRNGCAESMGGKRVFAANVDPSIGGAGGETGNGESLDDGEGVAFHEHAVLEGAWFRFVAVGHHMFWPAVLVGDGTPLDPGREGRTATARQTRLADRVDHRVGTHVDRCCEGPVTAIGSVGIQ